MKLRRVLTDDGLQVEVLQQDGSWAGAPEATSLVGATFNSDWEVAVAQHHWDVSGQCLPFQPVSFRDFMLYERHAVDAARGLVARFMPAAAPVARAFEKVSGRTFPAFRPKPLFYRQPIYYMSNHLSFVPSGTPMEFPS